MLISELHEWVISVATETIRDSTTLSVDTPSEHVDIANTHDGGVYPFVGVVPISLTAVDNGLGNSSLVPTAVTTENGNTVGVEEILRRDFTLEVTPVTDDDAYSRDLLVDDLTLTFARRIEGNDTPHDVTKLSVDETTPSDRPDSFVRGSGVTLTGRLHTASDRELPTAETVYTEVTDDFSATRSFTVDGTNNT
jgi:hypothetical protein